RGFSVVGIPGDADPMLASLRNTPLMAWNCAADELVNLQDSEAAQQHLADLGLRHIEWLFPAADHLTLATNDEYAPGVEFLGSARVDRDPPHVTFVVNGVEDNVAATAVADHAYWLSQVRARDAAAPGTIDVRSEGFGVADAPAGTVVEGAGALMDGAHGPMPYVSRTLEWGDAPAAPVANVLHVAATNVSSVTIAPARARVDCSARLDVTTDGPLTVTLEGCGSSSFAP
ncbi:MAG TPA: hypothetical protein VM369_06515, partial [Candidatus Binatia bacterium]|nr:hypothetical protein [Candidatus Binatia bacterium]